MADPLAIAKEVFPIASQALDFAKNTRNFVIELQAAEAEKQKVNKLWGSIEFKLTAGNDLAAALAHLPQRSRPPIDDVLYLVYVTVGVRLGTSGRARDDRTKTYLFGIVVRSVLRAYRAAALALSHAQAGATPIASGLKSDAPEHRALVQALQTMIQFQPRASMWDLLGANDIVQHLKDRIADVSPSILGRTIAWQRGGCCGPNWCCNSDDRRFRGRFVRRRGRPGGATPRGHLLEQEPAWRSRGLRPRCGPTRRRATQARQTQAAHGVRRTGQGDHADHSGGGASCCCTRGSFLGGLAWRCRVPVCCRSIVFVHRFGTGAALLNRWLGARLSPYGGVVLRPLLRR
jgi:hypothetical protein